MTKVPNLHIDIADLLLVIVVSNFGWFVKYAVGQSKNIHLSNSALSLPCMVAFSGMIGGVYSWDLQANWETISFYMHLSSNIEMMKYVWVKFLVGR